MCMFIFATIAMLIVGVSDLGSIAKFTGFVLCLMLIAFTLAVTGPYGKYFSTSSNQEETVSEKFGSFA
jgi:hypothetical protein